MGRALELNPAVGEAVAEAGCDTVCHGWRWIDYRLVSAEREREHIARNVETVQRLTGARPLGWYTGRPSPNTRRLVVEHGGFLFDSDDYNDDLPYWVVVAGRRHLVIPHSFDANDSRFARGSGLETAEQFFAYLRDAFDWLYAEGAERPKMMTVSLHCRLIGHPGRIGAWPAFSTTPWATTGFGSASAPKSHGTGTRSTTPRNRLRERRMAARRAMGRRPAVDRAAKLAVGRAAAWPTAPGGTSGARPHREPAAVRQPTCRSARG